MATTYQILAKIIGYGFLVYTGIMISYFFVYKTIDRMVRRFFRRDYIKEKMDKICADYPNDQAQKDSLIRELREKAIILAGLNDFEVKTYQEQKIKENAKIEKRKLKEAKKRYKEELKNVATSIKSETKTKNTIWGWFKRIFTKTRTDRAGQEINRDGEPKHERILPLQTIKRVGKNKPKLSLIKQQRSEFN